MRQKSNTNALSSEDMVKGIRRATRKRYSAEEKIRIVLDGLRGEHSIAELCRREGIAEGLYYSWSKEFLEAGKRRLAGDTARAATGDEVKALRREAQDLKEVVAEQALELRLLKKSMIADGGDVDAEHRFAMTHEALRPREARDHPLGRAIASPCPANPGDAGHPPVDLLSLVRSLSSRRARGAR